MFLKINKNQSQMVFSHVLITTTYINITVMEKKLWCCDVVTWFFFHSCEHNYFHEMSSFMIFCDISILTKFRFQIKKKKMWSWPRLKSLQLINKKMTLWMFRLEMHCELWIFTGRRNIPKHHEMTFHEIKDVTAQIFVIHVIITR